MSQETANTPPQPCEQLLDYVYGDLDEAGRRAFEAHLAGCPRCPAELQSFGRVRVASERLMPKVEPSAALTGALHAQLMHAAAQRKPKRGKLLAFPRKIMAHPGWAAAAMFVIVGGAVAVSTIGQGPVSIMKSEPRPQSAPAVASAPVAPVEREAAEGAAPPPAPPPQPKPEAKQEYYAAKDKEVVEDIPLSQKAPRKGGVAGGGEGSASRGRVAVAASEPRTVGPISNGVIGGVASTGAGADHKASRSDDGTKTTSGLGQRTDDSLKRRSVASMSDSTSQDDMKLIQPGFGKAQVQQPSVAGTEERKLARRDVAPGDSRSAGGGGGPSAPAAAPAPVAQAAAPPPAMKSVAQPEPQANLEVASAMPAPTASAPQAPARAHKPSSVARGDVVDEFYRAPQMTSSYGGNTNDRSNDSVIAHADKLATSNRCDEAIKVYQDLDRRGARVPGKSRARYVRCLSQTGRQEQALRQLDQLKADKNATSADVQNAEAELRPSTNAPKKKAKSNQSYDAAKPVPAMTSEPPPASQRRVPAEAR